MTIEPPHGSTSRKRARMREDLPDETIKETIKDERGLPEEELTISGNN